MSATANEGPASAELAGELEALSGLLAGAAAAEERALLQVRSYPYMQLMYIYVSGYTAP